MKGLTAVILAALLVVVWFGSIVQAQEPTMINVVVYAGGDFINVSLSGGFSWRTTDLGSPIQAIELVKGSQGQQAYVGTKTLKLFQTTDAGQNWPEIFDFGAMVAGFLENPSIAFVTVDPNDPKTVYVGLHHTHDEEWYSRGMLLKSRDGGQSFSSDLLPHGTDNDWLQSGLYSLALSPVDSNVLAIGQNGFNNPVQAVMLSNDGGASWVSISPPEIGPRPPGTMPNFSRRTWVAFGPSGRLWVLSGHGIGGIWVHTSDDLGASWQSFKPNNSAEQRTTRYTLLVHPENDQIAWIGGPSFDLQATHDGGQTWPTLPHRFSSLAWASDHLFGAEVLLDEEDVFVSDDGGATWTSIWQPGMGDNVRLDAETITTQTMQRWQEDLLVEIEERGATAEPTVGATAEPEEPELPRFESVREPPGGGIDVPAAVVAIVSFAYGVAAAVGRGARWLRDRLKERLPPWADKALMGVGILAATPLPGDETVALIGIGLLALGASLVAQHPEITPWDWDININLPFLAQEEAAQAPTAAAEISGEPSLFPEGPERPDAGDELPEDVAQEFTDVTRNTLDRALKVCRYWGGRSRQFSNWLTLVETVDMINSTGVSPHDALKLPETNWATNLDCFDIRAGTRVYLGGIRGGSSWAKQIWIEDTGALTLLP